MILETVVMCTFVVKTVNFEGEGKFTDKMRTASCYTLNVHLAGNAGFQVVINDSFCQKCDMDERNVDTV